MADWTGDDWLSRRLACATMICGALVVDCFLLSRHMRGGLAGAGTTTVPWGHRITRPPTPLSGVESPLCHPFSSTICRPPAPTAEWCNTIYICSTYT
eukprot:COSAG01_NODE_3119_length_6560_cov_719.065315_4_plen_97_part_00